jgi:coenzyme F420-reducing hydrogenase beta subunit
VEVSLGWSKVIIRTDLGEELLSQAEAAKIVKSQPLPEDNFKHLREASLLKKKRALLRLKGRGELEDGYLILSHELIGRILSEANEAGV